jgi:stalled ribosome rescue protein Dom34
MPDLVRWEDGAHVAPYVRALKQSRPVTAVVADSRRVRIFRYQYDELREEGVIWSDATITDSSSAGSSNRASTRSGARGEPRGDAARRGEEVSTQRMLREALDALSQPVSDGHLIVVAGTSETTAAFVRALPERARERTIDVSGVPVEASPAALKEAIETAASALSLRLQQGLVEEILEATRSAGRACVGREQTERALQAGAVDTLVFSRAFARAQPDLAERFVDRALEQGATVEEIPEAVANELDGEGGVGARLRFTA